MRPICVLNSGGFDSTLLLHQLKEIYSDTMIYSLFFDYGQPNLEQEKECSFKNAIKLQCVPHKIKISPITWTTNNFYRGADQDNTKDNYLEMRNLIFLSYALSLCESIGADKIFAAFMKPPPLNSGYNDASVEFVKRFNDLAINTAGVHFYAPLMEYEKFDLISWVSHHKITPQDFHTCNIPIDGKRCGVCPDCEELKKIFKNY